MRMKWVRAFIRRPWAAALVALLLAGQAWVHAGAKSERIALTLLGFDTVELCLGGSGKGTTPIHHNAGHDCCCLSHVAIVDGNPRVAVAAPQKTYIQVLTPKLRAVALRSFLSDGPIRARGPPTEA